MIRQDGDSDANSSAPRASTTKPSPVPGLCATLLGGRNIASRAADPVGRSRQLMLLLVSSQQCNDTPICLHFHHRAHGSPCKDQGCLPEPCHRKPFVVFDIMHARDPSLPTTLIKSFDAIKDIRCCKGLPTSLHCKQCEFQCKIPRPPVGTVKEHVRTHFAPRSCHLSKVTSRPRNISAHCDNNLSLFRHHLRLHHALSVDHSRPREGCDRTTIRTLISTMTTM